MTGFGDGSAGTVVAFDGTSGLGTIRAEDGAEHAFHCVEIADGTRSISVGADVTFDLLPKFGRIEAAVIRSVAGPAGVETGARSGARRADSGL